MAAEEGGGEPRNNMGNHLQPAPGNGRRGEERRRGRGQRAGAGREAGPGPGPGRGAGPGSGAGAAGRARDRLRGELSPAAGLGREPGKAAGRPPGCFWELKRQGTASGVKMIEQ